MTRKGFTMPCADPIADLITRHHLLRLVSGRERRRAGRWLTKSAA